MKVITVTSIKGGSGKTTLVQALATGALEQNKTVHMIDSDVDRQLLDWQNKASVADYGELPRLDWPKNLTVGSTPTTVDLLYEEIENLEEKGVDLLLIDTRPGEATATEDLILASDLTLIPIRPTQSDFVAAQMTVEWMSRLITSVADGQRVPMISGVIVDADKTNLNVLFAENDAEREQALRKIHSQDKEVLIALSEIPTLPTPLPESKMAKRMPLTGPLTYARDMYLQDPKMRLQVGHLQSAIDYCVALEEDALSAMN